MTNQSNVLLVVFSVKSACARVAQIVLSPLFYGQDLYATRAQAEMSETAPELIEPLREDPEAHAGPDPSSRPPFIQSTPGLPLVTPLSSGVESPSRHVVAVNCQERQAHADPR